MLSRMLRLVTSFASSGIVAASGPSRSTAVVPLADPPWHGDGRGEVEERGWGGEAEVWRLAGDGCGAGWPATAKEAAAGRGDAPCPCSGNVFGSEPMLFSPRCAHSHHARTMRIQHRTGSNNRQSRRSSGKVETKSRRGRGEVEPEAKYVGVRRMHAAYHTKAPWTPIGVTDSPPLSWRGGVELACTRLRRPSPVVSVSPPLTSGPFCTWT